MNTVSASQSKSSARWRRVPLIMLAFAATWCAAGNAQVTTPLSPDDELLAAAKPPRLIALRFHHDLCPYCKTLDPLFAELAQRANHKSVLFVTLDLSTEAAQQQAGLLAGALGLQSAWPGNYSKLGTVTFVDANTRRVLSSVRAYKTKPLADALDRAVKMLRGR